MAKLVLANAKKATLLTQKVIYLNSLRYKLYTAVTGGAPTGASVIGDFTIVSDTGHAAAGMAPNFGTTILNGANQGQTTGAAINWTFTFSGGVPFTILGYVVIDPTDGKLVYSQVAPAPFTCSGAGQSYSVTPLMLEDTLP